MNRPNVNDNDIGWEDVFFNRRLQLVDNLSNFLEGRIIVPLNEHNLNWYKPRANFQCDTLEWMFSTKADNLSNLLEGCIIALFKLTRKTSEFSAQYTWMNVLNKSLHIAHIKTARRPTRASLKLRTYIIWLATIAVGINFYFQWQIKIKGPPGSKGRKKNMH